MSDILVCRCEEISEDEILEAIDAGARSLDEIKRRTRAGMGLCQGKTCQRLAARLLARELCCTLGEVAPYNARPPTRPLPMAVFVKDDGDSAMRCFAQELDAPRGRRDFIQQEWHSFQSKGGAPMAIDALSSPGPNVTKQERGARILREAVLCGDLLPGQRLRQREVAEWLGMSATPVREVMRILEAEGLLLRIPFKGVFVAKVSPEEAAEITPIRAALESLAVRLSVPNLTHADFAHLEQLNREIEEAWERMDLAQVRRSNYYFHAALYEGCRSDTLFGLIQGLWPRFATDMLWMIPGRTERSVRQHRAILQAGRAYDAEAAAELMANHISTAGEAIGQFLGQQGTSLPQQGLSGGMGLSQGQTGEPPQ